MSRLNAFLDSEMEQVLCFDTVIDAERFCKEKSALFIVMPEENPNAYFMISLLIQQLYREILAVADENGGKLRNRAIFQGPRFPNGADRLGQQEQERSVSKPTNDRTAPDDGR